MIHAICGKTGGGKSYLALRLIVEELRSSADSVVLTNLSVFPDKLAEFLHNRYGDSYRAGQRIILLTEDQTARFWAHRRDGVRNLVVIDELHMYFNARLWAKTGYDALAYLSQHRKFGDEVWWISQHPDQVEKQFRSLTSDWTYTRNGAHEKLLQFFRPPNRIWYSVFLSQQSRQPMESHVIRLDLALASCYDTCAGVGVNTLNTLGDKGRTAKGLPFIWLVLAVLAAAVLGVYFFFRSPDFAKKLWKQPPPSKSRTVLPTNSLPSNTLPPLSLALPTPSFSRSSSPSPSSSAPQSPWWSGTYEESGIRRYYLSDGRVFQGNFVTSPDSQSVYIQGVWYSRKKIIDNPSSDAKMSPW